MGDWESQWSVARPVAVHAADLQPSVFCPASLVDQSLCHRTVPGTAKSCEVDVLGYLGFFSGCERHICTSVCHTTELHGNRVIHVGQQRTHPGFPCKELSLSSLFPPQEQDLTCRSVWCSYVPAVCLRGAAASGKELCSCTDSWSSACSACLGEWQLWPLMLEDTAEVSSAVFLSNTFNMSYDIWCFHNLQFLELRENVQISISLQRFRLHKLLGL